MWNRPRSVTRPKCSPVLMKSPERKLRTAFSMMPAMALLRKVPPLRAMPAEIKMPIKVSNWPRTESSRGNPSTTARMPIQKGMAKAQ